MLAVADGRRLTLPDKPDDVVAVEVCAVSGLAPGPHCPHVHDYTVRGRPAAPPCDWHDERGAVHYPAQGRGWMARTGR
jgi:hypothetical protein